MEIAVRHAEVSDAGDIARAHVVAWQVAYRGIVPDEHLAGLVLADRTELWRAILNGEITVDGVPRPTDFVVEVNGEVAGFADVGAFRDPPLDPTAGELWAMYVHPDHWGVGAADALMNAAMDELTRQGFERAHLWVLEDNDRARRFYTRHGWQDEGVIEPFEIDGTPIPEVRYTIGVL